MNITFLMCIFNIYTPTLIFLHPTFSSLYSSSTNPMIRLENIVFSFRFKGSLDKLYKKTSHIFNSSSKGFTNWIIHKVGLFVKQLYPNASIIFVQLYISMQTQTGLKQVLDVKHHKRSITHQINLIELYFNLSSSKLTKGYG